MQKGGNLLGSDIAKFTGMPLRTINEWRASGIIPITQDMATAVQAVVKEWRDKAKAKQVRVEATRSPEDLEEIELEQKKATLAETIQRERKLRIQNDLDEGLCVLASEVEETWQPIVIAIDKRLGSIPNSLAHRLVGLDDVNLIQSILEKAINDVKKELGGEDFVDSAISSEESP